ncbi:MAG: hypothetical protein XD58_0541 [Thermotoga sp. 50_1627]|nr:MAG: HAD-superfamily hydrolase, subfamily IA, variant 3 [Thermotoga sp. 50_64]KUK25499.1 MAG: hypothetical protein XD58_0541 [Thermotoga sp. 50_1627]MDK2922990.1 hypothetical protein [Pseudothermotoga sp.]
MFTVFIWVYIPIPAGTDIKNLIALKRIESG